MADHDGGQLGELLHQLRRIGRSGAAADVQETFALCARAQPATAAAPWTVRDLAYGQDPAQVLDVHGPDPLRTPRPVLLFVHGGGFVGGSRRLPGTPFYDNVGGWASAHGMLAVTVDYRLAPRARWPAGADDVAAALAWTQRHIGEHGGDPARVVLVGHSAGAAHVASYLAGHAGAVRPPAGAVLLSGIYDVPLARRTAQGEQGGQLAAYYGTSETEAHSSLPALLGGDLPLLLGVAEFDLPLFQAQAAALVPAIAARSGALPPLIWVPGHTHFSEVLTLGLDQLALGAVLARFLRGLLEP